MTHLFMGIDPRWIIREPYIPLINKPGILKASDLGIQVNDGARVFIFPNVGSYFGGDLIAGIFYANLNQQSDAAILVDVGTNAEVVVGNENWLIACAGAAGPALEGGMTKMGMAPDHQRKTLRVKIHGRSRRLPDSDPNASAGPVCMELRCGEKKDCPKHSTHHHLTPSDLAM